MMKPTFLAAVLITVLDHIKENEGAQLHAVGQHKFENWLQVEFVRALRVHKVAADHIRIEQKVGNFYWDVVLEGSPTMLIDLKVFSAKRLSTDSGQLCKSIKKQTEVTDQSNSVKWYLILALGIGQEKLAVELEKIDAWQKDVEPVQVADTGYVFWARPIQQ